jgi:hypothetical protein
MFLPFWTARKQGKNDEHLAYHVRKRHQWTWVQYNGDTERGLYRRLIPAWEHATCVRTAQLCHCGVWCHTFSFFARQSVSQWPIRSN